MLFNILEKVLLKQLPTISNALQNVRFFKILATIAPLVVTYIAIKNFPLKKLSEKNINFILNILNILLIVMILQLVNAIVSVILNHLSNKYTGENHCKNPKSSIQNHIICNGFNNCF